MSLHNTAQQYGSIAKWFHWSTALLFLAAYTAVKYRHWFTEKDTPENWIALQLHLSFGITIGVLVVLRIVWRWMNRLPDPEPGSRLAHAAAHWGHMLLYIVMCVAPLTGYLGTGVSTDYFFLFEILKFESTALFQWVVADWAGLTFDSFEQPVDFIHKEILGEYLIPVLIFGHIAAALYHHVVRKDRTLQKMTHLKRAP